MSIWLSKAGKKEENSDMDGKKIKLNKAKD